MDKVAERLKVYVDTHPFNPGDSDCETVLDQRYQAYAESHESDPPEISKGFKELEEFLCIFRWMTTMPCSAAAACATLMRAKDLLMACYMAHI